MRSSTLLLFASASSSESSGRGFSLSMPARPASPMPQPLSDADARKSKRVRQQRAEDPAARGRGDDQSDDLQARANRIASGQPRLGHAETEHDDDRHRYRGEQRDL